MSNVVAVRVSDKLHAALTRAAADDFSNPAAIARQAIVADLRRRGLLPVTGEAPAHG
jgi:predicted transcriptional regulator